MCRASLVHPPEIRRLRDLTRYRRALVQDRTREQQRIEKLLEDAQIKISAVLSELHGVTARAMMEALDLRTARSERAGPAGQGSSTKKTAQLEEALRGFFTDHHAAILRSRVACQTSAASKLPVTKAARAARSPNVEQAAPP